MAYFDLNVDALRARSTLDISSNLFNKDELKKLFIFNYKLTLGTGKVISLNNNQNYQCFRNAAFYIFMRYQKTIWELIDKLPISGNYSLIASDSDKNKYLIIQTMIELMDDDIINRISTGSSIERKRTFFLDNRLEKFITSGDEKYKSLGLLTNHRNDFLLERANEFGMMGTNASKISQALAYYPTHGGLSAAVINFMLANIFNNNTSNKDLVNISDLKSSNFGGGDEDYILYEIKRESPASDVFTEINNKKLIKNINNKYYKLVGLLYDCPNDTAHQITSLCFGNQCTDVSINGYILHNFHDDSLFLNKKSLNPVDFRIGVNTNLQYGCRTGGINVQYLLYEKVSAVSELNADVRKFLEDKKLKYNDLIIHGGGNNNDYYKLKYLKYKAKYLKLKNN
jgi:hypothetical protein